YDKLVSLGSKAGPSIVKAVKGKDHALRMQALKFATANELVSDELAASVVKKYKSLSEEAKCDVLYWLGDNKVKSQKAFLTSAVAQGGKPAKAAIEALGKIGGSDAQKVLIDQLGGENNAEAFRALCSFPEKLNLLEALKTAEGDKKLSLLNLASARRYTEAAKDIFALTQDKTYGAAALDALTGVATPDQSKIIMGALAATKDTQSISKWQKAATACLQSLSVDDQYKEISLFVNNPQMPNKERLYPLLAATGTDAAVADLEKIGDAAAIEALGKADNYKAAKALLAAAKNGNQKALMNYVSLVSSKEKNLDNRSARLSEAFGLAKSVADKKTILSKLAGTPTRNAFLLASQQLDDKELGYTAATAAKEIITKTTEDIEYDVAKSSLEKCINIFKGTGDADDGYAVDALRQKLSEMKPVEPYVLSDEEKKQGFELLFDGTNLDNFVGNKVGYVPINGCINVTANYGNESNLYTKKEYRDFIFRFEFCFLRPGVNNGVGIRTPMGVDAAYYGMCESQILDHDDPIYAGLREYQVHGSVYGVIPAKRIKHKPLGEWSEEEIRVQGNHITVTVNGEVIVDGDIKEACQGHNVAPDGSDNNPYTVDHRNHPGMFNKTGHIGFLGHGAGLKFRAVRVLDLT
ncbi:MAG: 3-keto-disaccharide hydrolase, partial [Prevotella sp.]